MKDGRKPKRGRMGVTFLHEFFVWQKRRQIASRHAVVCFRTEEDEIHTRNQVLRYFLVDTVAMHVRYEWVIGTRMSHVTHGWVMPRVNESCHAWMSHVSYEYTNEWCNMWMIHGATKGVISYVTESCQIWMCRFPSVHMNESRHTGGSHNIREWVVSYMDESYLI